VKRGRIYRENDQKLILEDVMLTTNPFERMRGLLGHPPLNPDQGLLLRPCSSIHTIGMSFPIDIVFINQHWRIQKLFSNLGKFRLVWCKNSHMVLETMAHTIARWELKPDDVLRWEDI